jgi:hypothetical protein
MPLTITAEASDQDKHVGEVYAVIYHNDKLYSAAVDGKIKVKNNFLLLHSIMTFTHGMYCIILIIM